MKLRLAIMIISGSLFPLCSQSQDTQVMLMSELRTGYSTNTYLNPFFSEWDRSFKSGYGLASTFGQLSWDKGKHNFEINGGYVFEPFFVDQPSWRGYLAYAKYVGQISQKLSAGINTGSTSFQSDFTRNLHWVQPFVTWFPTAFTSLSLKAGSNFREYVGFQDSLDSNNRIDSYALEIESWPGFRWQLKGGIYGNLDNLNAIHDGLSTAFSVGYIFSNGSKITSELQFINYSSEITTSVDSDDEPGGPPFNRPSPTEESETIQDQIYKLKAEGAYPFNRNISVFISSEYSFYQSSSLENNIADVQVSAGVRFNLNPQINLTGKKRIEPRWNQLIDQQTIRVKYRGTGNLSIVGDFNNWEKPGIPLIETSDNHYKAVVDLESGVYEYRILLTNGRDEEWLEFSNNVYTITDSFSGTNAVLTVE